jgi:hypothetical protein
MAGIEALKSFGSQGKYVALLCIFGRTIRRSLLEKGLRVKARGCGARLVIMNRIPK